MQKFRCLQLKFCILMLICMSVAIRASATETKHLVIGVEDLSYFPYFDYNHSETSLSKTILDKFAADNGYTISYVALPIKQFSKWLYENDIDFKYPDNKRWHGIKENEHSAEYYSDAIFYLRAGTVVLKENQDQPKSFYKNLGMISGFDPTLWKQEIAKGEVSILDDSSTKVLIKHLVTGLVDGVDIDLAVAQNYLEDLGIDKQITYSKALQQDVFSHQLSTIKYPDIIKKFNQWLSENVSYIKAAQNKFHVPIEQPETLNDK